MPCDKKIKPGSFWEGVNGWFRLGCLLGTPIAFLIDMRLGGIFFLVFCVYATIDGFRSDWYFKHLKPDAFFLPLEERKEMLYRHPMPLVLYEFSSGAVLEENGIVVEEVKKSELTYAGESALFLCVDRWIWREFQDALKTLPWAALSERLWEYFNQVGFEVLFIPIEMDPDGSGGSWYHTGVRRVQIVLAEDAKKHHIYL